MAGHGDTAARDGGARELVVSGAMPKLSTPGAATDFDEADAAELLRWLEQSVRGILAQVGGSQAELDWFEAPGGLERLAEELKLPLSEVLEKMGCTSIEHFLAEARADMTKLQLEVSALEQALASVADGLPWPLWQQTFGVAPTAGLMPVHLAVVEDKAEWPSFLHFHGLNQRTDFLGAHALGAPMLREPSVEHVRHFTTWTFGVAQRRGLFIDGRRRAAFEGLSSHSAVRESALEGFLAEACFLLEVEWNVRVDEASAKARSWLSRGDLEPKRTLQAVHGLVAELLQMSPLECAGLYEAYVAEDKPRPRCR